MTAKEILLGMKKLAGFDAPAPPAQPPVNPAPTTGTTISSYNVDGGGAIFVDNSDDGVADIDSGDKVYSDPAATVPYPDGTYTVTGTQFGFTVAGGSVSVVNDPAGTGPGAPVTDPGAMAAPVTTAIPAPPTMEQRIAAIEAMLGKLIPGTAPAAMSIQTDVVALTPDTIAEMYAKFGTGNSNDRLANLEIMVKALMECNFGYQIRQGQEAEAVQAYKESIAGQVSDLLASTQKFDAHIAAIENQKTKITEQDEKIKKQDEVIKGLFELAEKLVQEPNDTPRTLNGTKKEKFNRAASVDKYAGVLAGLKEAKTK